MSTGSIASDAEDFTPSGPRRRRTASARSAVEATRKGDCYSNSGRYTDNDDEEEEEEFDHHDEAKQQHQAPPRPTAPRRESRQGQRSAANARERARMRVLSRGFSRLKTSLPWVPADTKLSKLDTLRLASSYISHLRQLLQDERFERSFAHPVNLTWPFVMSGRLEEQEENNNNNNNMSSGRRTLCGASA